jgi:Transcriptional regulatory protein, C terminal
MVTIFLVTHDMNFHKVLCPIWQDAGFAPYEKITDSTTLLDGQGGLLWWHSPMPPDERLLARHTLWTFQYCHTGPGDHGAGVHFDFPLRFGALLDRYQLYKAGQDYKDLSQYETAYFHFVPSARRVQTPEGNHGIQLTDKENELLLHLFRATAPQTRDEILAAVWGYHPDMTTHTFETHLYRLRTKLDPFMKGHQSIRLENGSYVLNKEKS